MKLRASSSFCPGWLALTALVALGSATVAVAWPGGAPSGAPAPAQAPMAILARVDQGVITAADLDAAIAALPNEERLMLGTPRLLREFLAALIDQRLMADAVRRMGIDRDEPLRTALQRTGDSPVARDALLAATYLERRLAGLPVLDEAALRKDYAAHASEYSLPQRARVMRLVFASEEGARAALDAARAGVEFEGLTKRPAAGLRSADTVWLQKPPRPSPLDEAIFGLRAGQVSGVLRVPSGFLLVKALETVPPSTRPFAEVRDGIRARLDTERRDELRAAARSELRAKAVIVEDAAAIADYQRRAGARS